MFAVNVLIVLHDQLKIIGVNLHISLVLLLQSTCVTKSDPHR